MYINYSDLNGERSIGIRKKILAQCRVFEKEFGTVYYTINNGQMIYLLLNEQVIEKEFAITNKQGNEAILKWLEKYNIKRTYIRYPLSDIWFIEFIEVLKKKNIKSVLEFPTIPYDNEGWVRRPQEDQYYRKQLHKYIDRCTTYANYNTVFNIPCIPLVNGVDIKEQKEKKYRKKDGSIILLAVASHEKWHGYERIIQGMNKYYSDGGKRNFVFNIVGNGSQLKYYQTLAEEYQLCKNINFCGKLTGEDLDEIYDNSDIAIGSLGLYKVGIRSNAPIKSQEYCARGIPFVYGYEEILFNKNQYFVHQVANDATPVNMNDIIDFYEQIYDGRNLIEDMRQYAILNLTWDKILQPVIYYLT